MWQIGILFLRGPHCERFTWFGYEGGWESRKKVVEERKRQKMREEQGEENKDSTARTSDDKKDDKSPEPENEKVDVEVADPTRVV